MRPRLAAMGILGRAGVMHRRTAFGCGLSTLTLLAVANAAMTLAVLVKLFIH